MEVVMITFWINAIKNGIKLKDVFQIVKKFKKSNPIRLILK